MYIKIWYHFK